MEKEDKELDIRKAMASMNLAPEDNQTTFTKLEDSIDFKCSRCGQCCMDREDIILTPFDIYNIAKAKNITTEEVLKNYTKVHIGKNSNVPVVILSHNEKHMCHFLTFDIFSGLFGCEINNNKPGACALHPVGIVRKLSMKQHVDDQINGEEDIHEFILTDMCDHHQTGTPVKIKDHISSYLNNLEEHDASAFIHLRLQEYIDLKKFVRTLVFPDSEYIKENIDEDTQILLGQMSKDTREKNYILYYTSLLGAIYISDKDRPFIEQAEEKKNDIIQVSAMFAVIADIFKIDIRRPDMPNKDIFDTLVKEILQVQLEKEIFE